jgi:hypothetical protein
MLLHNYAHDIWTALLTYTDSPLLSQPLLSKTFLT